MTRHLQINQPFDLELSLTMGQAFRWRSLGDGWFSGVLGENLVHIRQTEGGVEYRVGGPDGECSANRKDDRMLLRYFRDDDGVDEIYADISSRDPVMADLVQWYRGFRVLRQEPWECMVSYICSANNSIEGIKRCVDSVSMEFSEPVFLDGETRMTFPTPERLADATEQRLRDLKLGYRAPWVVAAANRVVDSRINLENFKRMSYQNATTRLKQYDGIGDKIAACVVLMSLDKLEAFPVDTHIRKLVSGWWFGYDKPPSDHIIVEWAQDYFGPNAGYAGQFMFCDRGQARSRTTSGTSRRDSRDTGKSENQKFNDHRVRRCPFCDAPPGRHCKTPGGHYLLQGHAARRSQTARPMSSTRRRSRARRTIRSARPRR